MFHGFNILKSTNLFISENNTKCFLGNLNQHIRMISEGSCDTEDWRKGCFA